MGEGGGREGVMKALSSTSNGGTFFSLLLLHPHPAPRCPSVHSLFFLSSESKADTLNALNDIDLNLWGVRVILMGVYVKVEQREGHGVCGAGEDDLCAPAGHKARARAPGALCLTMCPRIVKWLCYREQVNCVSLPPLLYFPLYYDLQGPFFSPATSP